VIHNISGQVRKQPLLPGSMVAVGFAIALVFVIPALGPGKQRSDFVDDVERHQGTASRD
jgi:hypothetical protein